MKNRKTCQRELDKIEKLLCRYGKCKLSEEDRRMLYGAAQALGWFLELNYLRASKCIIKEN